MTFSVPLHGAKSRVDDLKRLYVFQLERAGGDLRQADAALDAIRRGVAVLECLARRPAEALLAAT